MALQQGQQQEQIARVSGNLVALVDIVFAVVIAESLIRYEDIIFRPTWGLSFASIMLVYFTVVLSWVDYHVSMDKYPYNRNRTAWWLRFFADVMIVVVYTYLLFAVHGVDLKGTLARFLPGFGVVFFLYLVSGFGRFLEHGGEASNFKLIIFFGALLCLLAGGYAAVQNALPDWFADWKKQVNWASVGLAFALVIAYRVTRWRHLAKRVAR